MYVEIDNKPKNGEDTQNYACGWLRIMMLLRIVNYKINEVDQEDDEDNLPHGAKVLK